MIIMCAWHPKYYGTERRLGVKVPCDDASISHSICSDCAQRVINKNDLDLTLEALDQLFK